jgi:flagellar biosynthesis/type III secretory pathway protein FliH
MTSTIAWSDPVTPASCAEKGRARGMALTYKDGYQKGYSDGYNEAYAGATGAHYEPRPDAWDGPDYKACVAAGPTAVSAWTLGVQEARAANEQYVRGYSHGYTAGKRDGLTAGQQARIKSADHASKDDK